MDNSQPAIMASTSSEPGFEYARRNRERRGVCVFEGGDATDGRRTAGTDLEFPRIIELGGSNLRSLKSLYRFGFAFSVTSSL